MKKIWYDGKMVDWPKAQVHVLTHGLHYGSAVFEGIRAYKTKRGSAVFRLKEHVERFFYSASVLGIKIPFSKKEIEKAILELIKINKDKECYIRPIAFLGYGKMGLKPKGAPVNVAIINWPWGAYLGEEKPIKTIISKYIRIHPGSSVMEAKISGCYYNSVLASIEVQKKRVEEAILLDFKGFVAEGPGENIFIVKKGKIFTPSSGTILPGITRESVIQIAQEIGYKVKEKKITVKELKTADEVFFTGTAAEVCPIGQIDKTIINNKKIGEVTRKIKESFNKTVRGEDNHYLKWLSFYD